ncbi:hypothetical protein OBBRIDRAFT_772486 [Obba rivulosa]|uniref:Protein EFR3 n=1 Tax=Obba rivulosa TaxID=1052685 RepID=A0A8E2AXR3_9APHY|nr:hypothetical protein OBBRIDRAFT_772486 [Obba rivulosa]
MHLPFTPNHILLISACYPPSASLLTAGPEYRPNSQELSRLTYYVTNRPGKVHKIGSELERKVRVDSRKAQAGNIRARASLLITLYIFKTLATECRRDIALLSASLIASVNVTLSALAGDLEVAARAASVFTAWTTYTDGHLIGVDRNITQDYIACLQGFACMGGTKLPDHEVQNRTRLVGLAALMAAVNSEALFHPSTHFKPQVSIIMHALLTSVLEVDVATLEHEAAVMKEHPNSPYLDEFRTRPAIERRAASIHLHIDGDTGPSSSDVANASLRALSSLLGHSNGGQAASVMVAAFETFDDVEGWERAPNCRWLAAKAAEWTQYQYRYAIPTRLVESLAEGQDTPQTTARHSSLAMMITTVFTSPTPLINLSTSDIISNLIGFILRRVSINPDDPLLPALVACIASLGTHVYYADQIQDLAAELIGRLVLVETNGISGVGKLNREKGRVQAVRCLLAGLLGLIHAADTHEPPKDGTQDGETSSKVGTSSTLPAPDSATHDVHLRPSRRTRVSPETWQETLTLLCDIEYPVRADYSAALISYLQSEIPKLGHYADAEEGVKRRPLEEGPSRQANTMQALVYGDSTTKLLNALHAYLYALATSSTLGLHSGSPGPTPERSFTSNASGEKDGRASRESPQSRERRSATLSSRARKTSIIMRVLQQAPARLTLPVSVSATLSDYGNILGVLQAVQEHLPVRGLLTGVPMLLALERAVESEGTSPPPHVFRTIKEVVIRAWITIGKVWKCSEVVEAAEKVIATSSTTNLPGVPQVHPGTLQEPRVPIPLPSESADIGDLPEFSGGDFVRLLATSQNVQEATGLDEASLLRRMLTQWSAESAYREAVEGRTAYDSLRGDGISPLIKVAPALMNIDNMSLQSLARSTRGVGVTDLREALEGRSSVSNPNLANKAPSISTLDHTSSIATGEQFHKLAPTRSRPQRSKLAGPGEVREVLNKFGIGKQTGNSLLKSPFPAQKPQQRSMPVAPPYTA